METTEKAKFLIKSAKRKKGVKESGGQYWLAHALGVHRLTITNRLKNNDWAKLEVRRIDELFETINMINNG